METQGRRTTGDRKPQSEQKHPDEWQRDLNPYHLAGRNPGPDTESGERGVATAYDLKALHRSLHDIPDDGLRAILVVPSGTRLQQGATYLDLAEPRRAPFAATGDLEATPEHCYVPKDQVPYPVWTRLVGQEVPGGGRAG